MKEIKYSCNHTFGQNIVKPAEIKTKIVIIVNIVTMLVEILGALIYGSMALLADGIHMGAHVLALSISLFAYRYMRKNADNQKFSFGTGKVDALAGYTGAIFLLIFAFGMAGESVRRIIEPENIEFNISLLIAIAGLVINLICVFILGHGHAHGHGHEHIHDRNDRNDRNDHGHAHHDHEHHAHEHHAHEQSSNFKSVYLHVLTDALTSVLAIVALIVGKFTGIVLFDAIIGILGAILILFWSKNLIAETTETLLDKQNEGMSQKVQAVIAQYEDLVIEDIHVWRIGPGIYSCELMLHADEHCAVAEIRKKLSEIPCLVHLMLEIRCNNCECDDNDNPDDTCA